MQMAVITQSRSFHNLQNSVYLKFDLRKHANQKIDNIVVFGTKTKQFYQLEETRYFQHTRPRFSGLGGAETSLDNEEVRITKMYLCNANRIK